MVSESVSKLKLSIWRDFIPGRPLVYRRLGKTDQEVLTEASNLQQEVYSWQTREDPFAGISDDRLRMRLQELLLERFEPSHDPADRRMSALSDFFRESNEALEAGRAEWALSQDAPADDEKAPYRINALLSLKLHLEWVAAAFAGQPGVSMSVR